MITGIGFDMHTLVNRLSITFDWYYKSTSDWLVQAPITNIYGNMPHMLMEVKLRTMEWSFLWADKTKTKIVFIIALMQILHLIKTKLPS